MKRVFSIIAIIVGLIVAIPSGYALGYIVVNGGPNPEREVRWDQGKGLSAPKERVMRPDLWILFGAPFVFGIGITSLGALALWETRKRPMR